MSNIAIFVSGSGTNMENLLRRGKEGYFKGHQFSLVVCDKPGAPAMDKARRLGAEVALIERKNFATKDEYEHAILHRLETKAIDYIALAGYMKIVGPVLLRPYLGRIINIHPALLPAFPGGHAIKDAFEAKAKETGVTVHFVDEGVDTGPVILQRKLAVDPQDTLESLETKIHALEYEIYPEALTLVLSEKIKFPSHHRDSEFWTND